MPDQIKRKGWMTNMAEQLHGIYLDPTGLSQVWSEIIKNFVKQEAGKGLSTNDLTDILLAKLNGIAEGAQVNVIESVAVNGVAIDINEETKTVDITVPTGALAELDEVGEENLSAALAELIAAKATKAYVDEELAKKANAADVYTKTEVYTKEETETAINNAVARAYKVKGSIDFENLPTEGMANGDMYNVYDAFVTTDAFVEGAGVAYPAGTNIVWVEELGKWDCMVGTYDFSDFLMKDDIRSMTTEEIAAICVMPEV